MHDPILVTGFPRSGTSMITGLLHICGAWAGETVGPSPANPKGFFENVFLREAVNKQLLKQLDCDPLGVKKIPELDDVRSLDPIKFAVESHLNVQGYKGGPWVFKDAKLSLLWPKWVEAFPSAKWVIVSRDPAECVASCLRTDFMRQHSPIHDFWVKLHEKYTERLRELCAQVEWHEVFPREIIDGDWGGFRRVVESLGLTFDKGACEAFVEKKHWHDSPEGLRPEWAVTDINVSSEALRKNITHSLALGLEDLRPLHPNTRKFCIVGGGPSLKKTFKKLRRMKKQGAVIAATNATHDWLIKRKVVPDFMVMLDARPDNVGFVQNPHPEVVYLLASQCDPGIFDALKGNKVILWHSHDTVIEGLAPENKPIIGLGSTVGIQAIDIGMVLGFRDFNLFGMDGCYSEGKHHAYDQKLNDADMAREYVLGDKSFLCSPWMIRQAEDFKNLIYKYGRLFRMEVHGEGMLRHMIRETIRLEKQIEKESAA